MRMEKFVEFFPIDNVGMVLKKYHNRNSNCKSKRITFNCDKNRLDRTFRITHFTVSTSKN